MDGYAELRTECLTGGVWNTVTSTEEGVPPFPNGGTEYPAPDVDSMTCGCQDLELMFNGAPYNPENIVVQYQQKGMVCFTIDCGC